jgi:hypothetical protein
VLALALALGSSLTACGGSSGHGYRVADNPIVVQSTTISGDLRTGVSLEYPLDLQGGCGGPYVLSVVEGTLPPGLGLDDETASIRGVLLVEGAYTFTLQVTDVGCAPFSATTATFSLDVSRGPLVFVGATPALLPVDAIGPTYPALPTTVYNDFRSVALQVAGGTPPYRIDLHDDPAIPDGNLPQGVVIPDGSTSIVGSPVEIPSGGVPFLITLRATDAANPPNEAFLTVYWKIDTPPIQIVTTSLADGRCGSIYSERVFVIDGVPPFVFALVEDGPTPGTFFTQSLAGDGDATDVEYNSPGEPLIFGNPVSATPFGRMLTAAVYPLTSDDAGGTEDYSGRVPAPLSEGLYLIEASGSLSGVPRRVGRFKLNVHVASTLVPFERGQQAWVGYEVEMAPSDPPAPGDAPFSQTPDYTVDGVFPALPEYAAIPEAEVGVAYNPDIGRGGAFTAPGLQLTARGGVPKDGWTDAPHASQRTNIEGVGGPGQEDPGNYAWEVDWNPLGVPGQTAPAGVAFDDWLGWLRVADGNLLAPQGPQVIRFTTRDQQLPDGRQNWTYHDVRLSVGPDTVIITESTTSEAITLSSANEVMNEHNMTIRALVPYSSTPVVRDLDDTKDLVGTIPTDFASSLPASGQLDTLLSGVDILRPTINPTTRNDDIHQLGYGARAFQNADRNPYTNYIGDGYPGNFYWWEPNAPAVQLMPTTAVTHDPENGVYADGGRLFAFENADYFGVFIIRRNSRISVPIVFDKSGTWKSFGDAVDEPQGASVRSSLRSPQMTFSPDMRYAAMKVRTTLPLASSTSDQWQTADATGIVIFDLTGATPFDSGTKGFKVIGTGSTSIGSEASSTGTGRYQYAASLTLSNTHLYYLCGNSYYQYYASWAFHWIYAYEILGGDSTGSLLDDFPVADGEWANTPNNPMQTAFQEFYLLSSGGYGYSNMYLYDGANVMENSVAPHPFRVNVEGDRCAILAAEMSASPLSYSDDNMKQHVWVHDATLGLRRASTVERHSPQGGGRGYSLARGSTYYHWGYRTGPTTGFEISDDGTKLAVVCNRTNSVYPASSAMWLERCDLVAFEEGSPGSWTEHFVSGDDNGSNLRFHGNQVWRFGALTFTRDNAGLVFWAGYSISGPTTVNSSNYYTSQSYIGSMYQYRFSDGRLRNALPSSAGGNTTSLTTNFTTSSPVNPTTSAANLSGGALRPIGGFHSRDGNFLYICQLCALTSSDATSNVLVGINVRSLDEAQGINGHPDGQGFAVGNWPSRYGFLPMYVYPPGYALQIRYYAPGRAQGGGWQMAATTNGRVFFAGHYQSGGPYTYPYESYGYLNLGSYSYDYGAYSGEIFVFDANVGGSVQQLTSLGGTTTYRMITHIVPNDDGTAVAFGYATNSTGRYYNYESVAYIGNIALDPANGQLQGGSYVAALTSSSGRSGEGMAHDFTGTKVFYGFGAGATNETGKTLWEVEFASDGSTTSRQIGAQRRYNVLWSGR